MYNKITIPALAASFIINCFMGYYLHQSINDLKYARDINELHTKEIQKLNSKIESMTLPEGFEIESMPTKKITQKNISYIPNQYKNTEMYIPIQGQWASNQPAYYANERALQSHSNNNLYDTARALNNIDVNMTLDSILPKTPIIYVYPEY